MQNKTTNHRNAALDYMKVLAVLLVMNSHMDICYPKYSMLSTGGILGDALFFFASGFGLFLGEVTRFDNWYKRRICRIYPSVLAAAIVSSLFFGFQENFLDVVTCKRYWFIGCILAYYVLLYPIKYFGNGKYVKPVFCLWIVISAIVYCVVYDGFINFYGGGFSRSLIFFLFMLQGAIVGKYQKEIIYKWWSIPLCLVSLCLWAVLCTIGRGSFIYFLSIIPFLGFTFCIYWLFSSGFFSRLYESKIIGNIVYIISQLCLDVYLIQKFCYTDALNYLFPLNILLLMTFVIVVSYLVHIIAGIISQVLSPAPIDWGKLIIKK